MTSRYPVLMGGSKYLDIAALAARMGWTEDSTRTLHARATKRRRENDVRPGDLPAPDEVFGRSPVWLWETIDEFEKSRPGQGAGGGRPYRRE